MSRDLARHEFAAALTRNGFKPAPGPFGALWFVDTTGACPGVNFGAVLHRGSGKIDRRGTLAHIIRGRTCQTAKRPE
jgi:hypothetical protein